ncbi:tail fiber assembly protein [Pseudomonas tolaasii]|uniref:Tail fiber assembly protein n=2 Tax=Pseudomonas tolaasii TaxID=29442 RepID=A0A7Y8ASF5_PSETO|nr:tail fiber assembly protein [Pseudomonas tolaasii]ARB29969.1 hypothetical protein B5P22_22635 [Pseudomonas tolaasii]KAB0476328.1 tail fiber assembly protein [Pseudomonas tolaasii]MBY8939790.1 tail fiber assembly protein [Pseudomonas tolaasii]NVZ43471.1 tail fiber assembly protein [Pseudomonas tolaasii]NWA50760.1 tail fiber assembly protein [Pseudomonas tolaasii]
MTTSAPVIYQAHPVTGEFMGTAVADPDPMVAGSWLIPAMALRDAPPHAEPGFAAIHVKGAAEAWTLVPDWRGTVYRTDTGEQIQWQQLGELPAELTPLERPGADHIWDGTTWRLDEAAKITQSAEAERQWRDTQIDSAKWLRERHRDESDLKRATTLTQAQFAQLLAYLQQLRDWPQSPDFPASASRPIRPVWMADLVQ